MNDYEKLGSFYLGKRWDETDKKVSDDLTLYDAKDLTTHAAVVGMTGSGKTGLCISLLEEAAIDGVPAIVLDPKGDIANLLLTFPGLRGEDFEPWVDPSEAARKGKSVFEYAEARAELWKKGLESWGQDGERIKRLKESAEFEVFTPGSVKGRPINILSALRAPSQLSDIGERVQSATAALMGLIGHKENDESDPAFAFLTALLAHNWQAGLSLSLETLVHGIQKPGFSKVGVMDLDVFFPMKERVALAMKFNSLLASPAFGAWTQGDALDVAKMLYSEKGKAKITILSIAHLSDEERMFFVTLMLGEICAWMRKQEGTPSLRALLYMDEVFGFLPPTGNPPSKKGFLTLLKQARAYGLGLILATQNPVDLDYKALSNCGTWFIGRLQTAQDVDRVMDGLKASASQAGKSLSPGEIRSRIAGLESRVFLMNNVHEDEAVLMHTRWVMSYLRGPMTLMQIASLTNSSPNQSIVPTAIGVRAPEQVEDNAPVLPEHLDVAFHGGAGDSFEPAVYTELSLQYVSSKAGIDEFRRVAGLAFFDGEDLDIDGLEVQDPGTLNLRGECKGSFSDLPGPAKTKTKWKKIGTSIKNAIYRTQTLSIFYSKEHKLYGRLDEGEEEFLGRLRQKQREARDAEVTKLKERYQKKLDSLQKKIESAEAKVEREQSQVSQKKMNTAINVGSTLLGALFGSRGISGATRSVRSFSQISKESTDVKLAEEKLKAVEEDFKEMQEEMEEELQGLRESYESEPKVESLEIRPRKTGIEVLSFKYLWWAG